MINVLSKFNFQVLIERRERERGTEQVWIVSKEEGTSEQSSYLYSLDFSMISMILVYSLSLYSKSSSLCTVTCELSADDNILDRC